MADNETKNKIVPGPPAPDQERPRNDRDYHGALHGVQAGVSLELQHDPASGTPKHLRVGINSAQINDAALARLLVKKGLITWEEYAEEVRLEANRELDRYEDRLTAALGGGTKITLV